MLSGIPDQSISYDVLIKRPQTLDEAVNLLTWHYSCKSGMKQKNSVRKIFFEDGNLKSENESDNEVRKLNQNRFVTEERLQQFGRNLTERISDKVTMAGTESLNETFKKRNKPKTPTKQAGRAFSGPVKCFGCNEEEHYRKDCPFQKREDKLDQRNINQGWSKGSDDGNNTSESLN